MKVSKNLTFYPMINPQHLLFIVKISTIATLKMKCNNISKDISSHKSKEQTCRKNSQIFSKNKFNNNNIHFDFKEQNLTVSNKSINLNHKSSNKNKKTNNLIIKSIISHKKSKIKINKCTDLSH